MRSGRSARAHGRSSCSAVANGPTSASRSKTSRLNSAAPMRAASVGQPKTRSCGTPSGYSAARSRSRRWRVDAVALRQPARVAIGQPAQRARHADARSLRRARQLRLGRDHAVGDLADHRRDLGLDAPAQAIGIGHARGRGAAMRASSSGSGRATSSAVKPQRVERAARRRLDAAKARARQHQRRVDAEVPVQRIQLGEVAELGRAADVRGGRQQRVLDDRPQQRRRREAERIARQRVEQRRRRDRRAAAVEPPLRLAVPRAEGLGTLRGFPSSIDSAARRRRARERRPAASRRAARPDSRSRRRAGAAPGAPAGRRSPPASVIARR